jgi:hypothetical protein
MAESGQVESSSLRAFAKCFFLLYSIGCLFIAETSSISKLIRLHKAIALHSVRNNFSFYLIKCLYQKMIQIIVLDFNQIYMFYVGWKFWYELFLKKSMKFGVLVKYGIFWNDKNKS